MNFEKTSILFEFANTEGAKITEGTVFDGDGDAIRKATISFTENYLKGEDTFFYDSLLTLELEFLWLPDTAGAGMLIIEGTYPTSIYTDALNALRYVNTNALAPNINPTSPELGILALFGGIVIGGFGFYLKFIRNKEKKI